MTFLIIPDSLLQRKDISTSAKLVLCRLVRYCNPETGQCNPKITTLADALGLTFWEAQRALGQLRKRGFLSWTKSRGASCYQIETCRIATLDLHYSKSGGSVSLLTEENNLKKTGKRACARSPSSPQKKKSPAQRSWRRPPGRAQSSTQYQENQEDRLARLYEEGRGGERLARLYEQRYGGEA